MEQIKNKTKNHNSNHSPYTELQSQDIQLILSDFDGTLTLPTPQLESEIHPCLMDVLQLLKEQRKELIIISGRPLSWGHFFLSHFPISAAILEGGGVILHRERAATGTSADPILSSSIREICLVSEEKRQYLNKITAQLFLVFPSLELTFDSWGRKTDRAIDLSLLKGSIKGEVEHFLTERQINHSTSSVHLNFWAGEVSKYKAYAHFHQQMFPHLTFNQCLYFGDALNDQSMFEKLPHSVGVSNIHHDLPRMKHHPTYILEGEENAGPMGVANVLRALSHSSS